MIDGFYSAAKHAIVLDNSANFKSNSILAFWHFKSNAPLAFLEVGRYAKSEVRVRVRVRHILYGYRYGYGTGTVRVQCGTGTVVVSTYRTHVLYRLYPYPYGTRRTKNPYQPSRTCINALARPLRTPRHKPNRKHGFHYS